MPRIDAPSSSDVSIGKLLENIDSGALQLPEFQRGWTWDDERIRAILATLTMGYPMGAVMCLACGAEADFEARPFEGVKETCEKPKMLVLDGQQRLTSIYRAAWARDPVETKAGKDQTVRRFYYLDIATCLDEESDRIDAVVSVPEDHVVRTNFNRNVVLDLSSPEKEWEAGMFPLNVMFDVNAREDWADGYKEFHDSRECRERYKKFRTEVLKVVDEYKLPVIVLPEKTPRDAVCQVFEWVNTGGVSLTVFELVTASFARGKFDLRQDWTERIRPRVHAEGEPRATDIMQAVSEKDFLTAVTLYVSHEKKKSLGRGACSCRRKDVLDLSLDDYRNHCDAVVEGFRRARAFLADQHVFLKRDLPYAAQLIPLAAVCAAVGKTTAGREVLDHPKARAVLARWYWCGVFGEMYGGQTETIFAADMDDVPKAMRSVAEGLDPVPVRTANEASFAAGRLLTMQNRNSAAYKGMLALLFGHGARDFRSGSQVDIASIVMDTTPDIHHVFPQQWCTKHGVSKAKRDSIVNKTPLKPASNRAIGGAAPSAYARKLIEDGVREEELRLRVESNLVDWDAFMADDFQAHFVYRAKRLLDLVEAAMGKEAAGRDSAETVRQFGASLKDGAPEKKPCGSEQDPLADPPHSEDAEIGSADTNGAGAEAPPAGDRISSYGADSEAVALYGMLEERVFALGGVSAEPFKWYVSFKAGGKPFLSVSFMKAGLRMILNAKMKEVDDPAGLVRLSVQHMGPGECRIDLKTGMDMDAVLDLVRQAHRLAREKAQGRKPHASPSGEGFGEGPDSDSCADETVGVAECGRTSESMEFVAEKDPAVEEVAGHFKALPVATELFRLLHARVLGLEGVSFGRGNRFAWFKASGAEFLSVSFRRETLRLSLIARLGEIEDPFSISARNDSHFGVTEYKIYVGNSKDLDVAMHLIQQAHRLAMKKTGPERKSRDRFSRTRFWDAFCRHASGKSEMMTAFSFGKSKRNSWFDLPSGVPCPSIELAVLVRPRLVRAALFFRDDEELFRDFCGREEIISALDAGELVQEISGGEFRIHAEHGMEPENESSWSEAFDWLCAMSLRLKEIVGKYGR